MLKKSYIANYVQSYLWKILAMSLGVLSMLVVVPALADNKQIYGIYSVCISIGFFLSYADLGFYSAGLKYSGECYSSGDRDREYRILGFTSFILFVVVALISAVICILAFNPSLIMSGIKSGEETKVAKELLIIQAAFSFNSVIARLVDGVYSIRIENYIFQKYLSAGNLIKILSVFYFFSTHDYDIVGYFTFTKIVDVFISAAGLVTIQHRYGYSVGKLVSAFKFDHEIYRQINKLALATFVSTFLWIIYFELDTLAIGKFMGAENVAIFAVGLVLANYVRAMQSVLYAPFQSRFYQLAGEKEKKTSNDLLLKLVRLTMPAIIFSLLSVILLSKSIVLTWVGSSYSGSILIIQFFMLAFMWSFITIPASFLMAAKVETRPMYAVSVISVLTFWAGVYMTIGLLGIYAFAVFKFVSSTLAALVYLYFLLQHLDMRLNDFLKLTVYQVIIPVAIIFATIWLIGGYLPTEKGALNLFKVISVCISSVLLGFAVLYVASKNYRTNMRHYAALLIKRI